MKYEIGNPSDPYEMTCDDHEVAAIAVPILGQGAYPLIGKDGDRSRDVPHFLFGGADAWFRETFGRSYEESLDHVVETKADGLIAALDSVTLLVARRSSVNDIGGRAKAIAQRLRSRQAQSAPGRCVA